MPEANVRRNPWAPTPDEVREVFKIRLEMLEQVAQGASVAGDVPAEEREGYRACITWRGRSRDGSMRAEVMVSAPHLVQPYTRKLRLVRHQPLPADLGSGLRES